MNDELVKRFGRKPGPNPRNVRVTFLVTPGELAGLQAAANLTHAGNVSDLVRSIVLESINRPAVMSVAGTNEL